MKVVSQSNSRLPLRLRADVKRRWIEALRSGDYKQGSGYLLYKRHGDDKQRYCCLGVLCEVAIQDGVPLNKSNFAPAVSFFGPDGDSTLVDMPVAVMKWAGIAFDWDENKYMLPVYVREFPVMIPSAPSEPVFKETTLAELNDKGYTFDEIADIIEKYVPTWEEPDES